jgi:hypothetical protein
MGVPPAGYSSDSSLPKVGLCFDSLRDSLSVGILCTGGGVPITSRAKDFTALVALNFFLFFLVAIESAAHLRNIGIMQ